MADWILEDFTKNSDGELQAIIPGTKPEKMLDKWTSGNLGSMVCMGMREAHTKLDLTGPPASCSNVYFSLCFQLRKWEMQVQKVEEAIEVSPVHAQYYQLTTKQKEDIEAKIKSGLASAAQAVSDYELLKHDERKYQEFKNYYDTKDEHSLRAVFIDQVDVHTGDGISMRSIVSRWPTLITDFMRLTSEDMDYDKFRIRLGIPKAEAIVLLTKNKLYNEWKNMFIKEVEGRLGRIKDLILSRETSITQYREWLKPYVARFKMLEHAFESSSSRKSESTSFMRAGGQAISTSRVKLIVWKDFQPTELKRAAPELISEKPIPIYDKWLQKNVIFHSKWGLIRKYPWIIGKMPSGNMWIDDTVKWITNPNNGWIVPHRLYYGFMEITFDKTNVRGADGHELEDGVWDVNGLVMSQNILLAKLIEIKAKQEELERYIDRLLGIKPTPSEDFAVGKIEEEKIQLRETKIQLSSEKEKLSRLEKSMKASKDKSEKFRIEREVLEQKKKIENIEKNVKNKESAIELLSSPKEGMSLPWGMIAFKNRNPYERMLFERLAKYYAKTVAENIYAPTVAFLKDKFGFGRP